MCMSLIFTFFFPLKVNLLMWKTDSVSGWTSFLRKMPLDLPDFNRLPLCFPERFLVITWDLDMFQSIKKSFYLLEGSILCHYIISRNIKVSSFVYSHIWSLNIYWMIFKYYMTQAPSCKTAALSLHLSRGSLGLTGPALPFLQSPLLSVLHVCCSIQVWRNT